MGVAIDSKIQKWGNGLGLRVSGLMRDIPHFTENSPIIVEVFENGFTVRKAEPVIEKMPFSEAQLLAGLNPYTSHSELLVAPLASELVE